MFSHSALLSANLSRKMISPDAYLISAGLFSCPAYLFLVLLFGDISPSFLFVFMQVLGSPGDDLNPVPWQHLRCDEGPLIVFFSSHHPPPLLFLQALCRALLLFGGFRLVAGGLAVSRAALQAAAVLSADGSAPHSQHAAAKAQLSLPEPRLGGLRRPLSTRRGSEDLRGLAAEHCQPSPGALWRPRHRREHGSGDRHGGPRLRSGRDYRL